MAPTTADIRKFLTELFSDEELTILCYDYFRDVHDDFALGMSKGQKIQRLIERCDHRGAIPNLLAAMSAERAAQYSARFGPPVEAASPAEQPRHVRDPRQVFISHAHEDAEFAHRLAADLGARGWRVWIAPDSIRPGEKWVDAINRTLEECGVFLVVLTPSAVASKWVTDETNVAKEMHQEGELRFIPLGVVDCRVPPLWRVHQRVPFKQDAYPTGLAALLTELGSVGCQPGVPLLAAPVVEAQTAQPATARDVPSAVTHVPASQSAAPKVKLVATRRVRMPLDLLTMTSPIRIELVHVPAGDFMMGSDPKVDKDATADEQPQHRLYLPEFFIGKYPVTNEQYAAFVKAARQGAPEHWKNGQIPAGRGDHPVVDVSWQDAVAFCEWSSEGSGKLSRLPTEAEWEKAARGSDGRIYPWGNDPPTKERCNFGDYASGTTPVGHYPAGASPCGALDMAGNVWEWTGSLWGEDEGKPAFGYPYDAKGGREDLSAPNNILRVVRGGSWSNNQRYARCAFRHWYVPDLFYSYLGFRVVVSLSDSGF